MAEKKKSPAWVAIPVGIGLGVYVWDKFLRSKPLPPSQPPQPPTEMPTFDEIFAEIDQTITSLKKITDYIKTQVTGAQEVVTKNETLISTAQQEIAQTKDKLAKKTLTSADTERLLELLKSLLDQLGVNNQLLGAVLASVQQAIVELTTIIKQLEEEIAKLKYLLEPVDTLVRIAISGKADGISKSAPFTLSIDQAVQVTGWIEAGGNWFFGYVECHGQIRDKTGVIIKDYMVYSRCVPLLCEGIKRISIDQPITLSAGMYSLQISGSGIGNAGGDITIHYRTARFIVQQQ